MIGRLLCKIGVHDWRIIILRYAAPQWWLDEGREARDFDGAVPIHGMDCSRCFVVHPEHRDRL